MVLGALLDLFWIPFGDHLGDVLALVGLFGALFGRQSAVILFILASDKAPKRTFDNFSGAFRTSYSRFGTSTHHFGTSTDLL